MAESGLIFDLQKFSVQDGPGIRTTVFFKGCPLKCAWCHNPESKNPHTEVMQLNTGNTSQSSVRFGYEISVENLMREIDKDAVFYEESGGGVTFSGGEPFMQIEFLYSLLKACKIRNYHTAIDTCGFTEWENFEKINSLVDIYLYDLKLIDNDKHLKYTGVSNRLILDNLQRLDSLPARIIIRIPLIPDITDTSENLSELVAQLIELKNTLEIDLLPYNKLGEDKCQRFGLEYKIAGQDVQNEVALQRIRDMFYSAGLNVRIGG